MIQTLISMDLLNIFILIGIIVILFFLIWNVCRIIANKYINNHKKELFDKTKPLSNICSTAGIKLLNEQSIYWAYINELGFNQKYKCSSSIVSNASKNAVKYLIKYSNTEHNEYCLQKIDYCINWLKLYDGTISDMRLLGGNIKEHIPFFVKQFISSNKLPFTVCNVDYTLASFNKPKFIFSYTSPAGKSGRNFEIEISVEILESIKSEIYAKASRSGHSKAQRSAMTNDLREAIKKRDNYTCCICGNSVFNEPNLLLEVDHIIPISKGGKTEANNLQTLCWRCNRSKSDNM